MAFTGAFHSMEGGYVFGTLAAMPWPVGEKAQPDWGVLRRRVFGGAGL